MNKSIKYPPEVKFCVRYLLNHGINVTNLIQVQQSLSSDDADFKLVPVSQDEKDFFTELAEKMRELWPPGEKDGKYPWRDSVSNLSRRLKLLWDERGIKDKSIDDCLVVARKYLAQFENNAKYMQTLKYFIMKQDQMVKSNGRITYTNKSTFADMLESNSMMEEWGDVFESSNTVDQGLFI